MNSADSFSERMDELYPDEHKAQDTEDMTKADESEYSEKYEEEYDENAEEIAEEAQQGSVTEERDSSTDSLEYWATTSFCQPTTRVTTQKRATLSRKRTTRRQGF